MDVLYLLIPLSALLVLGILGIFAWALHSGQFDDLEQQGAQILEGARDSLDDNQAERAAAAKQSRRGERTAATTEDP
ncbi:MAG TPA: cbb3-type cytochrome oxidase assembly protein CcoS [Burkholderiaceae bacterium]|nr:cbb3-type cytochrome oxidase assembly protein CcoS [Burkholderiaceae bacterium]